MGFILFCAAEGGQRRTHSFLYHNLDNIDLTQGKYGEYLRFTSRGKAVTLKGPWADVDAVRLAQPHARCRLRV